MAEICRVEWSDVDGPLSKATGEISQQIFSIQTATQESVGAIKDIGDTIRRMSEISSTIASAVEEQGAATKEISRNVPRAAEGIISTPLLEAKTPHLVTSSLVSNRRPS